MQSYIYAEKAHNKHHHHLPKAFGVYYTAILAESESGGEIGGAGKIGEETRMYK